LVALLATGLERIFSQSPGQDSPPHSVDYSEGLSPTTNTPREGPHRSGPELNRTHKDQQGQSSVKDVKCVGLVVRVSTDRQAANDEGSLKNQLQRLRKHIEYKSVACEERWQETAVYELRAISGKDSMRSPELQKLFGNIRAGRINTVLCTALDRICRSVKDFLWFFENLNEHGVEFVCLKQNYDTTTSQGKLFVTIMMALAEFERDQTSERNRDATAARAERGLWNGGRLLGYDLDANRRGHLIPNPQEAVLVNFAFDTYLKCGSMKETAEALNRRGYRTKSFSSRRGKDHPGVEFGTSSVQYLLKNPAYVGKKQINKKGQNGKEYRLVPAVWPAIVEEEKFEKVQRLMAANGRTNHNGSQPVRHTYCLAGLLRCGRCRGPMKGRSGTGKLKVTYYYYACVDQGCGVRVAADEVEGAVLERLGVLAREEQILDQLMARTNARLQRHTPGLLKQRQELQRTLAQVNRTADRLLTGWASLEDDSVSNAFIGDKLNQLSRQRSELESGISAIDGALDSAKQLAVDAAEIHQAMASISEVYNCLQPFEQKELMQLILQVAEINERKMVLEIRTGLV
jgi:site-specific DNA recombinase